MSGCHAREFEVNLKKNIIEKIEQIMKRDP